MLTTRTPCSDDKDFASQSGRPMALDVRHQVVFCGDGTQQRRAIIGCVERNQSIPLADCMQCDRCAGLFHDMSHGRSRVLCGSVSMSGVAVSAVVTDAREADAEPATHMPISTIMARDVVCVRPDLSLQALRTLLLERSIGGVPVVDDDGRPIGVVSKTDVVRSVQDQGSTSELDMRMFRSGAASQVGRGFHECELADATVEEIMTPVSFTLPENASVAQAAALMAYEGIHRIPVVSVSQQVVGILSSLDVLRWLARRSGYLVPATTQQQRT